MRYGGRLYLYTIAPFDRMLIAQAQNEAMTLISADLMFKQYEVSVLWAASKNKEI